MDNLTKYGPAILNNNGNLEASMCVTNIGEYVKLSDIKEWQHEYYGRATGNIGTPAEQSASPTNTGGPKFCFNCKPGSVLENKMVDSKYIYCPYCGAKPLAEKEPIKRAPPIELVERIEEDFASSPVPGVCCITINDWELIKSKLK